MNPLTDFTPRVDRSHTILIVDDSPTNLNVITDYLKNGDYRVITAQNGEKALELCVSERPDIVLLDVMMPGINGFETCRRMKSNEFTKDIPVIFMTALKEPSDKVKGFESGAVDYITKPFQFAEVLARVATHLRLRDLTRKLQETNENLIERTMELSQTLDHLKSAQKQLIESEKMAALGGLVAGVAHEINTPIGICITTASTLERESKSLSEAYEKGQLKRSVMEAYLHMIAQCNRLILTNLHRTADLVQSFKQVAVDQTSLQKRRFPIKAYIEEILLSLKPRLKQTGHILTVKGDENITMYSYPGAFSQVVTNLVMNSIIHAYPKNESGHLYFNLIQEQQQVIIEYSDNGCGIPPENLAKIFDPFFTTARDRGGSGLGLHIVYNLAVQKLKGTIHCESQIGSGTKFFLSMPLQIGKEE